MAKILGISYTKEKPNIARIYVTVQNDEDREVDIFIDFIYRMGKWINPELPGVFQPFYGCQLYFRPMNFAKIDYPFWCRVCTNERFASEQSGWMPACARFKPGEIAVLYFDVALDGSEVPPPPWKKAIGPIVRLEIALREGIGGSVGQPRQWKTLEIPMAREPFKPPVPEVHGRTIMEPRNVQKIGDGVYKMDIYVEYHGTSTLAKNLVVYWILKSPHSAVYGRQDDLYFIWVDQCRPIEDFWLGYTFWAPGAIIHDGWSTTIKDVILVAKTPLKENVVVDFCGAEINTVQDKVVARPVDCKPFIFEIEKPTCPECPVDVDIPTQVEALKTYEMSLVDVHGRKIGGSYKIELLDAPPLGVLYLTYVDPWEIEHRPGLKKGKTLKFDTKKPVKFTVFVPGRYVIKICGSCLYHEYYTVEKIVEIVASPPQGKPIPKIVDVEFSSIAEPLKETDIVVKCRNIGVNGGPVVLLISGYRQKGRAVPLIYVYDQNGRPLGWKPWDPGMMLGYEAVWFPDYIHYMYHGEERELRLRMRLPDIEYVCLTLSTAIKLTCQIGSTLYEAFPYPVDSTLDPICIYVTRGKRVATLTINVEPNILVAGREASLNVKLRLKPPLGIDRNMRIDATLKIDDREAKLLTVKTVMPSGVDTYDKWYNFVVPDLGLEPEKEYIGELVVEAEIDGEVLRTSLSVIYKQTS